MAIVLSTFYAIKERRPEPELHIMSCASSSKLSTKSNDKCSEPPVCVRYLADSFVTPQDSSSLLSSSSRVMSLTSVAGGAAIFDARSGALSRGTAFVNGLRSLYGNRRHRYVLEYHDGSWYQRCSAILPSVRNVSAFKL